MRTTVIMGTMATPIASVEYQLDAVKGSGLLIEYIVTPSEEVQIAAINQA